MLYNTNSLQLRSKCPIFSTTRLKETKNQTPPPKKPYRSLLCQCWWYQECHAPRIRIRPFRKSYKPTHQERGAFFSCFLLFWARAKSLTSGCVRACSFHQPPGGWRRGERALKCTGSDRGDDERPGMLLFFVRVSILLVGLSGRTDGRLVVCLTFIQSV